MSSKKKIALAFAAPLALIALCLVVEHFRGKWGLARWKARMAARGEPLTIGAASAPMPPLDENGMPALLAAASQMTFAPATVWPPTRRYVAAGKVIVITKVNDWPSRNGRRLTNTTWEAMAHEIEKREPALKLAMQALAYPQFSSRVDYNIGWTLPLPHLAQIWRTVEALCASALLELRHGRVDAGVARLEAAIRYVGALENERLWVSQHVRMGRAQVLFEHTWQAVHAEGLSDQHLDNIQKAWTRLDFLPGVMGALSMEAVMAAAEFERFRQADLSIVDWLEGRPSPKPAPASTGAFLEAMFDGTAELLRDGIYTTLWKFAWSRQDELRHLETIQERLDACRIAARQKSAAPLRPFGDSLEGPDFTRMREYSTNFYDHFRYVVSPRGRTFFSSLQRAWAAQTLRELAVTGVALKRYLLRHGKTAPNLEALLPEFLPELPRDFMDGQVLKYNGTWLYSAGVDGKDDGGDVTADVLRTFDILKGKDFVWPQPASAEEVTARFQLDR